MPIDSVGSSHVFTQNSNAIQRNSERIASGSRINSAADDAAGLAISNRLSSQIEEFSQAARNANDGVSYLQVADGGLSSITDSLNRIRELALQASNGTLNNSDRQALDAEAQQLKDEITRGIETTSFNGQALFDNDEQVSIQLGADSNDQVDISVQNLGQFLEDINFEDLNLSSAAGAQSALGTVDEFQQQVASAGADIGAQLNRLDSSISTLFNSEINATESRSRIADADLAKEISELTANRIRQDAAIAVRAQANEQEKGVLRLLEP